MFPIEKKIQCGSTDNFKKADGKPALKRSGTSCNLFEQQRSVEAIEKPAFVTTVKKSGFHRDFFHVMASLHGKICSKQVIKGLLQKTSFDESNQIEPESKFFARLEVCFDILKQDFSADNINYKNLAAHCLAVVLELRSRIESLKASLRFIVQVAYIKDVTNYYQNYITDFKDLDDKQVEEKIKILQQLQKHYFRFIPVEGIHHAQACFDLGKVGLDHRDCQFAIAFFQKTSILNPIGSKEYYEWIDKIFSVLQAYESENYSDNNKDSYLTEFLNYIREIKYEGLNKIEIKDNSDDESVDTGSYHSGDENDPIKEFWSKGV